ncbi:MAG: hypothetical protein ACNA8R_13745 [Nitriliruptoraceae bacterium]
MTGIPGPDRSEDAAQRDRAIQRALASVPGVVAVRVVRDAGTGSGRLRLRLRTSTDRDAVTRAVVATLAERFAIRIDPDAIRVTTEPTPVTPQSTPVRVPVPVPGTSSLVARRASITHLNIVHAERDVRVTIGLAHDDQRVEGTARTVPDPDRVLRAVAEATAAALQRLTVQPVDLEILEVVLTPDAEPARVLVAVRFRAGPGDEHLLGVSVIREDPERAVVRATLDAVNRRVEPLLQEDVAG